MLRSVVGIFFLVGGMSRHDDLLLLFFFFNVLCPKPAGSEKNLKKGVGLVGSPSLFLGLVRSPPGLRKGREDWGHVRERF